MNAEQGVLTVIGELRGIVFDLQERNKDLQAKLDSIEFEYKAYKEKYPIDNIAKFEMIQK